ncbi:hypothetical protein K435DRAFT_649992, partial [Dendrothele bispora CBS 962.96]
MNFICTACNLKGKSMIVNTDYSRWSRRNVESMWNASYAWRRANTLAEQKRIFDEHGVRWSSLWELAYWDPTRMLVVDSMHCILEGIVHYHCRHVLRLNNAASKLSTDGFKYAYDWPWEAYHPDMVPTGFEIPEQHITRVSKIQEALCLALEGEKSLKLSSVWNRLDRNGTLASLRFVAFTLDLVPGQLDVRPEISSLYVERAQSKSKKPVTFPAGKDATTKHHFIALLLNWRLDREMISNARILPTGTPETLQYVQHVITNTKTPSWINSVPKNYGEASAGTIKADEWRTLSTIYLPIALVTLWGDDDGCAPPDDDSDQGMLFKALEHSMALFQAT